MRYFGIILVCLLSFCGEALAQAPAGNASLSATSTSANVKLPVSTTQYPSIIIAPALGTTQEVFYALGGASVAATTSSPALPSGGICLNVGPNTYVAAITAANTATLRITQLNTCAGFAGGGAGSSGSGGSVTQGTSPWVSSLSDGTNGPVAVKAASTAPAAADKALVTTLSPNTGEVGTPGTGYTQPSGGVGLSGWLSGIYHALVNALSVTETTTFAATVSSAVTRVANTTTYTANTGWCTLASSCVTTFSWAGACRANGSNVLLTNLSVYSSANPSLKLSGVLWLFNVVPGTIISDDATFNIASADFANLVGGSFNGIPFNLASAQASGAANSGVSVTGINAQIACAVGATTLYGMVEVTNAYVPASGEILTVKIHTIGLN